VPDDRTPLLNEQSSKCRLYFTIRVAMMGFWAPSVKQDAEGRDAVEPQQAGSRCCEAQQAGLLLLLF